MISQNNTNVADIDLWEEKREGMIEIFSPLLDPNKESLMDGKVIESDVNLFCSCHEGFVSDSNVDYYVWTQR